MTSKASHTDLRVSSLANAATLIGNVCFEAREATRANLGITYAAHTTTRKTGSEASETFATNFGIALLAYATPRKIGSMRLGALETACPNFGVTLSADTTPVEEAIPIASETARANFLVSSATDNALWWRPQVIDHASRDTPEAA